MIFDIRPNHRPCSYFKTQIRSVRLCAMANENKVQRAKSAVLSLLFACSFVGHAAANPGILREKDIAS
jgi:hypothetical protein